MADVKSSDGTQDLRKTTTIEDGKKKVFVELIKDNRIKKRPTDLIDQRLVDLGIVTQQQIDDYNTAADQAEQAAKDQLLE